MKDTFTTISYIYDLSVPEMKIRNANDQIGTILVLTAARWHKAADGYCSFRWQYFWGWPVKDFQTYTGLLLGPECIVLAEKHMKK